MAFVGCDPTTPVQPQPGDGDGDTPPVYELSTETLTGVSMASPDAISFSEPVQYEEGDVLVAGVSERTPRGLLRRVTSVSADGRTVHTEQATLEDVITNGTVKIEGELAPEALSERSRRALRAAGMSLVAAQAVNDSNSLALDIPETIFSDGSSAFAISGTLAFSTRYHLTATYDGGLKDVAFDITPAVSSRLKVRRIASFSGGDLRMRIGSPLYFTPVTIPTPIGLPLILRPCSNCMSASME